MLRQLILSLLILMTAAGAYAAEAEKEAASVPAPVVTAKPRTAEEEKKLAETKKRIQERKTELNGSSWELVIDSADAKMKGKTDTFTFQNGQFSSKNYSDRGFVWTNYTVTIPSEDSETAVWETMQTGPEGVIFVRGEWTKDSMRGDITEQLDGGKKVINYGFNTASRKAIPPTSKEEVSAATESASPVREETGPSTKALVSKEGHRAVSAFKPGTTDEN